MSRLDEERMAVPQPGDFKVYNPYAQQSAPGMPSYAQPTLGQTDYLFSASEKKTRSVTDRMFYAAGFSYLAGQVVGLSAGYFEGRKEVRDKEMTSANQKVRGTIVANAMSRRGTFFSNTFGVLGLTFGVINGAMVKARGETDDSLNTIAAGIATGAAARLSQGVKGAARGATVGGMFAFGATAAYNLYNGQDALDGITRPLLELL